MPGMNAQHDPRYWQPSGWTDQPISGSDLNPSSRWVLPGVANLHSHAFQRAMAGLTERRGSGDDSFWTWRETMYALAERFDPDHLRAVAAQLYAEMLEAGYTSVCEFHYLHHAPDGSPYADPAAMSLALIEAARETGIQLCLLPTLYMQGGFDGRPLTARQRRFGHSTERFLGLLERLDRERGEGIDVGIALHSLRAVPPEVIADVLAARRSAGGPIHIHIAEQPAEVADCLAARGARPVAWLLDHHAVDERWCLVHATHIDDAECAALAGSGATVALCPTTEANLGDGLFPLAGFAAREGRYGIGSDSHASVSVVEELRWLEYGQRLRSLARNVAPRSAGESSGEALFRAVQAAGWSAANGRGFEPGVLTLDDTAVALAARGESRILDGWLFGSSRPMVDEVWVRGRRVVAGGRHVACESIGIRYRSALAALLEGL